MAHTLGLIAGLYDEVVTKFNDPRSKDWVLCTTPWTPTAIVAAYLFFVLVAGPRLMANRPAFNLRPVIITYNALQVVVNAYLSCVGWAIWYRELRSIACQPVDYRETEGTIQMANLVWVYYVLKIVDLMDTVFFVLRKKGNQATFLHVYHHFGMVYGGYLGCRFTLNGHLFLLGPINTFVHALLYTYYLLTLLWPAARAASWKKYITLVQLAQFCILGVHNALPFFQRDCRVQKLLTGGLFVQSIIMILMFSDFYRKAYLVKKKSS